MNMNAVVWVWRKLIAVTVLLALPASAGAQSPPQGRFTLADVFKLKSVGDVRISPDGRTIAYEALDTDIMTDGARRSVRLIDVASGEDRLLAERAQSPRWSPDSRSLVYADRAGDVERLMLATLAKGAPRLVAGLQTAPSAVTWSRDGQMLAFTRFVPEPAGPAVPTPPRPAGAHWAPALRVITTVRHDEDGSGAVTLGHKQLFVVPVAGGTPRQVTSAALDVVGDAAWLPDGRSLVYSAVNRDRFEPDFRAGRLYRVPVAGGASTALTSTDLAAQAPAVSPDGRRIAFIAWAADGRDFSPIRLRLMNLEGGPSQVLDEALDRDFYHVAWSADGRQLYAFYADRSVEKVRRIDVDGSDSREVATDLGGDFTVSDAGAIAYAAARPDRPTEVALVGAGAATPKLLTHRNDALLAGKALGITVPFAVRSSLDGAAVGAWLTQPVGYTAGQRYPLILDIHGGPYGYDGPVWETRDQLYAAAGYAVLHVNYRGSTSYGFAFADRIAADPLAPSSADLMSAVDAAVEAGIADSKRLFITGGSAGGELATWIIGHTPRFRAATAEKPVINQVAFKLASDQYYTSKLISGPAPWEDAARLWSLSPLSAVGQVVTPTLLVVGEGDHRTPPTEARQFYHALKLRGVPTALVLVPEASHSSLGARPSQLTALVQLTLDWFGRE